MSLRASSYPGKAIYKKRKGLRQSDAPRRDHSARERARLKRGASPINYRVAIANKIKERKRSKNKPGEGRRSERGIQEPVQNHDRRYHQVKASAQAKKKGGKRGEKMGTCAAQEHGIP